LLTSGTGKYVFIAVASQARRVLRRRAGKFRGSSRCSINNQFSGTKNYPSLLEPPADILPGILLLPLAQELRSFSRKLFLYGRSRTNGRGNKITNGTNRAFLVSRKLFYCAAAERRSHGIGRAVRRKSKVSHLQRERKKERENTSMYITLGAISVFSERFFY